MVTSSHDAERWHAMTSGDDVRCLCHGDLAVFGQNQTLVVILAVQGTISLGVVVQLECHLALATLEAEFVVDLVAGLLSFLGVHRLGTDLTLLGLGCDERHCFCLKDDRQVRRTKVDGLSVCV